MYNGGVKITKRMTILVLLLVFAILSISSVSANDVENNLAIDENSLTSSDEVSLDDSYNLLVTVLVMEVQILL